MDIIGYILAPLCTLLIGAVATYLQQQHGSRKALQDGVRALLRKEIVEAHELYVVRKAPCSVTIKDQMTDIYNAYHSLGGNGTVSKLYDEIMAVEIKEESWARG